MKAGPLVLSALVGVGLALASRPAKGRTSTAGAASSSVRDVASVVERDLGMPGFSDFAAAAAFGESRNNPSARNTSASEAARAADGFENIRAMYAVDERRPNDWTFGSGGWFGFLPSTALGEREWSSADPRLIFDPVAATVLMAAFAQRVARRHFDKLPASARDWLTVRRFMASNRVGLDFAEARPGTAARRRKLERHYRQTGSDPRSMRTPVQWSRRADQAYLQELKQREQS